MRGGYDKLCGVIRSLGEDLEDGTAYVFTSKDQKIVRSSDMNIMSVRCIIRSLTRI